MKKRIILVFSIILFNILFSVVVPHILATTSGTGGTGGGGGSASGSGSWSARFGFYLAVFDSTNNRKSNIVSKVTYDFYNKKNDISGWFKCKNDPNSNSLVCSTDPTKLYDYFNIPYVGKAGDYSGLKTFLKDNKLTLASGDYVLIEPFTQIGTTDNFNNGRDRYTFRNIVGSDNENFRKNYRTPAELLANSAKVGTNITVGGYTYTAPNYICNRNNYISGKLCGYPSNNFIGFGILVVKYEEIYPEPPKGSITLKKIDGDTGTALNGAQFSLYDSHKNLLKSCTSDWNGNCSFSDLVAGTYYLKETGVPTYYDESEIEYPSAYSKSGDYIQVNLTAGQDLNIGQVKNRKTCVSEFNGYNNNNALTRQIRLDLFGKYGFYQLLNFDNYDASSACTNTRDCGIRQSYTCSGISVSYSGFNGNNLSCYLPEASSNGKFCSVSFNLNTEVLRSFTQSPFKSGQLLYFNNNLPTLNLIKTCFNINGNSISENISLNDYITNIKINGLSDEGDKLTTKITKGTFNKTIQLTRKACISKIDGKEVSMDYCKATYEDYFKGKYLYKEALVPKFTTSGSVYVYPSLELSNKFIDEDGNALNLTINDSDKCVYNFEQELITTEENKNDELNIIFRIIDTTNPFPGMYGNGRLVGVNWCDDEHLCTVEQSKFVTEKILEAPNSKGLVTKDGTTTTSEPKYRIVLNSNTIKAIREYNKEHAYNEIEYECAGNNCENKFLKQYQGYFQIYKG